MIHLSSGILYSHQNDKSEVCSSIKETFIPQYPQWLGSRTPSESVDAQVSYIK
jgi:hypothetical protein